MPLLSYALVVITNRGLKWSKVATREHVGEWAWNILGNLPLALALSISIEPIFTFRTHVANQHGTIAGYLFLIACIVPCALLLRQAYKLNEENIETKALSAPLSHTIALLWTWLAITLLLNLNQIVEFFEEVAQLILFLGLG